MTKTNTDTMNTFEKVAARDALTLQPKMKTVTMWALVWNGRTSLKLYTKVQINRMVKNMAKRGVFAYGFDRYCGHAYGWRDYSFLVRHGHQEQYDRA
jgi:hypothetical protein